MKFRNKKTGEIIEGECFTDIVKKLHERGDVLCYGSLLNVDLFSEYWKEINSSEPTEPLIKDEKIRKAVRAWAEANDIERVWHEYSSCWLRGNGLTIELENEVTELEQGNYTIDELCGEEEAPEPLEPSFIDWRRTRTIENRIRPRKAPPSQ